MIGMYFPNLDVTVHQDDQTGEAVPTQSSWESGFNIQPDTFYNGRTRDYSDLRLTP